MSDVAKASGDQQETLGSSVTLPLETTTSLETTTPLQTQSTIWQDISRQLYSGCKQDTVACERSWSELASWTLHSAIAKKQNRQSTTSSKSVPSDRNRDTSYGRRLSQPPTSCGEQQKTCSTPPNSWQHVDWGSKHCWSTAEEVVCCSGLQTLSCLPNRKSCMAGNCRSQCALHCRIMCECMTFLLTLSVSLKKQIF